VGATPQATPQCPVGGKLMTGSEKAGVEVIDILGNNKGDDNRVNREETVTMVNKAKDLESGPGKLCTTISRHAAQQKIEKNLSRVA